MAVSERLDPVVEAYYGKKNGFKIAKGWDVLKKTKPNTVIFDLDGTIAEITRRRDKAMTSNGKTDWDIMYDPNNIDLDVPNEPVVSVLNMYWDNGYNIYIFSGRSNQTETATIEWLNKWEIPYDKLVMRDSSSKKLHFMKDSDLKKSWLNTHVDKNDVAVVYDDRQQVVDMWREEGLTAFQVAKGDF
jgi:trehalose-6-phosphatase